MMVMTRLVTDGSDESGECAVRVGVVIIDLEKDRLAIDLERAKVMFFVWIVSVAKVVVDFDRLDDARDRFRAKRSNARRHHRMTLAEILSQLVVERANAVRLCGFRLGRHGRLHCDR